MKAQLTFTFRFRASHHAVCHNAPDAYRHDHNYEVRALVAHEVGLAGLTKINEQLTQFSDHARERFNGKNLNEQLPLGMDPIAEAVALYLFLWLDLLLSDDLLSVTVNDFTAPPVTVTPHTRADVQLRLLPQAVS